MKLPLMPLLLLLALALAVPASGHYYSRGAYREGQEVRGGDIVGGRSIRGHNAPSQHPHPHAHPRPHSSHALSTHHHAKRSHSQLQGSANQRSRYVGMKQLLSRLTPTEPATPAPLLPPPAYIGRPATAPPPSHPHLHHHGGGYRGGGLHGDGGGHPTQDAYAYDDEGDDDDYDDFDEDDDVDDTDMEEDAPVDWDQPQSHPPNGGGAGSVAVSPETISPATMSPVSRTKWNTMGTRSGVDELRRARLSAAAKAQHATPGYQQAVEHLLRVNREGDCKVPKPRIVQVKQEYPHPHKIYLPRCTILHQCGDDTGCCNAESLTCVPRQAHRVELFFYTSTVGNGVQRVERLSFYNHTECGCEDRNSERLLRDHGHMLAKSSRGLFPAPAQQPQPRADHAPPPAPSCRCPSKYTVRPVREGSCLCDCFDKQRECLRLKKGKDYFSPQDRQCIQKGECRAPICEFGSYLRLAGRCPKKRERIGMWN